MRKRLQIQMLPAVLLFLFGISASAQVQLKMQEDFMTAIMGVNNGGNGISLNGYYDFETNAVSPTEEGVWSTSAITNDDTILGQIENSSGEIVAAVRINGVWEALPASAGLTEEDQLFDISEN